MAKDMAEAMKGKDTDKYTLNKRLNENHVFIQLIKYCAYQERCELEVMEKLKKYNLTGRETKRIIDRLKEENYLDNQRYAKIYTSGKLRNNKWGRIRIRYELKRKSIQDEYIIQALSSIDEKEYAQMVIELIRKKKKSIQKEDPFIVRNKILQYLCVKGFESDLARELIKEEIT